MLSHSLQHHKGNYNTITMKLELKYLNPKHWRKEVCMVSVEVEQDESILYYLKAIHIKQLLKFSNINLRKVLLVTFYKYLLLFNLAKAKKLPTQIIFEQEMKLNMEFKKG